MPSPVTVTVGMNPVASRQVVLAAVLSLGFRHPSIMGSSTSANATPSSWQLACHVAHRGKRLVVHLGPLSVVVAERVRIDTAR